MSNAPRRRPAKPGASQARSSRGIGLRVIVDGTTYEVWQSELTGLDANALRRATGLSFIGVVRALQSDPDLDVFAALVWLARRTHGEPGLLFDEVLSQFNYDTAIEMAEIGKADNDNAVQAEAGGPPEA